MRKRTDAQTKFRNKFERRAARFASLVKRLGLPLISDERKEAIYQRAVDIQRRKRAQRKADSRFDGCQSVTATARDLRMARFDLFGWLEREGWLYRVSDGWRPTERALDAGWTVLRGGGSAQWPQITPAGTQEIARRLGIVTGGEHRG